MLDITVNKIMESDIVQDIIKEYCLSDNECNRRMVAKLVVFKLIRQAGDAGASASPCGGKEGVSTLYT